MPYKIIDCPKCGHKLSTSPGARCPQCAMLPAKDGSALLGFGIFGAGGLLLVLCFRACAGCGTVVSVTPPVDSKVAGSSVTAPAVPESETDMDAKIDAAGAATDKPRYDNIGLRLPSVWMDAASKVQFCASEGYLMDQATSLRDRGASREQTPRIYNNDAAKKHLENDADSSSVEPVRSALNYVFDHPEMSQEDCIMKQLMNAKMAKVENDC